MCAKEFHIRKSRKTTNEFLLKREIAVKQPNRHSQFPFKMLLPLSVLLLLVVSAGAVKEEVIQSFLTNLDTPLSLLTHDEVVAVFDVFLLRND